MTKLAVQCTKGLNENCPDFYRVENIGTMRRLRETHLQIVKHHHRWFPSRVQQQNGKERNINSTDCNSSDSGTCNANITVKRESSLTSTKTKTKKNVSFSLHTDSITGEKLFLLTLMSSKNLNVHNTARYKFPVK